MALITCPNCGKQISDKAAACPQCGEAVVLAPAVPEEPKPIICEECGTELQPDAEVCPNCGCPVNTAEEPGEEAPQKVEVTAVNLPQMNKNTKKYIIIAAIAVIAIIAAIFIGKGIHNSNLEKQAAERSAQYIADIETASFSMLMGAIDAEDAGNLIKKVWYNSIYEERDSETDKYTRPNGYFLDDFNDALTYLFLDEDFIELCDGIEANQELVSGMMKELKNPPEEHEDAYDAIRELYDAYTDLTNLAINPSGNLSSFSENFNEADSEVANCYDAMKMYID